MNTSKRKPWTREELILAIILYCKTPFGRIHVRNPEIIKLAESLGRTPGSVSYKLANFAHIDPSLDRKGAANVAKLDREVWQEFYENGEALVYENEVKLMGLFGTLEEDELSLTHKEGKTGSATVKTRINQSFFRKMILSSYNHVCCITGINNAELLVASHIVPWSVDKKNRLNPMNGLCLNALHDRAFDKGLLTINENYQVVLSKKVNHELLLKYEKAFLSLPKRFLPDQNLLEFHRTEIFQD